MQKIAVARRQRRHNYAQDWVFPADHDPEEMAQAVIDWCKKIAGECRRPFGIDAFDLSVSVGQPQRLSTGVSDNRLKPIAFYEAELPERIVELFRGVACDLGPGEEKRVSARLFSWGEAAHAALPPTPQREGLRA